MNVLIIFCHPSRNSYTYHILQHLKEELINKKCSVEISDLYAIDFQSDMTEKEFEREGGGKIELPISQDVLNEHDKIKRANCIIFLYPVWWSDCPAKLKGWFDRVFTVGFAYKQTPNYPGMETLTYGVALCTAGYSNDHMKEIGIARSMENIMLNDRMGKRFVNKEMIILGGTLELDKAKQKHREQISALVAKVESYRSETSR